MSIDTLPRPDVIGSGENDAFDHVYCCDPDRGLCGADISGLPDLGESLGSLDRICPKCVELADAGGTCLSLGCPERTGG